MKSSNLLAALLISVAAASPMVPRRAVMLTPPVEVDRRDGTTEFDPDLAFRKEKRDGTTEFDPDLAFKKNRRDGTTEFDPDLAFKRSKKRDGTTEFDPDLAF
ncbi:hypothetical protein QC761_404500 [Podospora bellae-mahoneyi]|uniref:Uncharacterized protein n=1 Tax=Podospora bellae-mahoneyi TaxID=2093777 RepID=A0ABR0FIR0_9PEZI|nr:hypothetical protein QC761_404500 [Podospora bellae-mahoneyi]